MKKNKLQKFNDTFNKAVAEDEVFIPMTMIAVGTCVLAVLLDYGFQMIEAIDILTQ